MNSLHPVKKVPVGPPIAPAVISRGPVFQPRFKNLRTETIKWETPWAEVTVTGRLGGIHRKVLDAIFAEPIKTKRIESGAQMMVIDPYRIAKLTGTTKSHPQWLKTVLRDMQNANVTILDKVSGLHYWGHIISDIWESKKSAQQPGGALHGDRPLFVVTISPGWMQIYDTALVVRYRTVLPVLCQIESGAVHAVALHILTHSSSGNFEAESVLSIVGAITPDTSDRQRRRQLHAVVKEAERLARLGMQLYRNGNNHLMIAYTPTGDVHTQAPKK